MTETESSEAEGEITVAVRSGPAGLSGTIRSGATADQQFTGWLGLLSALEAAITAAQRGDAGIELR